MLEEPVNPGAIKGACSAFPDVIPKETCEKFVSWAESSREGPLTTHRAPVTAVGVATDKVAVVPEIELRVVTWSWTIFALETVLNALTLNSATVALTIFFIPDTRSCPPGPAPAMRMYTGNPFAWLSIIVWVK